MISGHLRPLILLMLSLIGFKAQGTQGSLKAVSMLKIYATKKWSTSVFFVEK